MAGETQITIVGNLVADPEKKFTPSGAAVAMFRVASTPRIFNRNANQWVDGEQLFLVCNAWREMAEHVAETLTKGMRVIVQGSLKQRSYETKGGEKRTVFELEVDEVGPSLKYSVAQVFKTQSAGFGSTMQQVNNVQAPQTGAQQSNGGFAASKPSDDEPQF